MNILVLFAFFLVSSCVGQESSNDVNTLPMNLYEVEGSGSGDLNCSSDIDLEFLTKKRQFTIQTYSDLKEAESFEAYDQGMRKLWDEIDPNVRVIVPAAGTYVGIEEVIEYISLVVGAVNNGYVYYYDANITNFKYYPQNSSYSFSVKQKVKFYCTEKPSSTNPGNCESEEIDSYSLHHVSFKPCSALIKQYVVAYANTDNYLATKGASAVTVCSRHSQWCKGENQQFKDFFECMKYMEEIPFATCGEVVFNGDNMICRFKHSFMVKFRPELHCAHIGPNSTPCNDEDCLGDFRACTDRPGDIAYTPRLHPRCCTESCSSRCPANISHPLQKYNA